MKLKKLIIANNRYSINSINSFESINWYVVMYMFYNEPENVRVLCSHFLSRFLRNWLYQQICCINIVKQ